MPFNRISSPLGLCIILFAACGGGAVESMLSPAQRFAVDELLREQTKAELVQPDECTSTLLERYQSEHANYTPYYAEADFNADGLPDFVIATRNAGAYDLWLFVGSPADYRRPQNFATVTWLNEAGFIVQGRNLYVGTFYGEDGITFSWDSQVGRFAIHAPEQK